MSDGFSLFDSPYRREVKKVQNDRSEFKVCEVNERVISRMPFNKKFMYIHLKENNEGETYWDVLVMKGDEPTHFTLGKSDSDSE